MKKLFAWFGVIIFTFAFGVFSALVCLELFKPKPNLETPQNEVPIFAVCELVNNAEKYSGKLVRLSADLHWFDHGYYLVDRNCLGPGFSSRIAIIFDKENANSIGQKLNGIRNKETVDPRDSINFIVVGKFTKVEKCEMCSDGIIDRTQLHFEIVEIENGYLK